MPAALALLKNEATHSPGLAAAAIVGRKTKAASSAATAGEARRNTLTRTITCPLPPPLAQALAQPGIPAPPSRRASSSPSPQGKVKAGRRVLFFGVSREVAGLHAGRWPISAWLPRR